LSGGYFDTCGDAASQSIHVHETYPQIQSLVLDPNAEGPADRVVGPYNPPGCRGEHRTPTPVLGSVGDDDVPGEMVCAVLLNAVRAPDVRGQRVAVVIKEA